MEQKDVKQLEPGLYRIYWRDGGSSLASVGMEADGARWLAPTNWVVPATSSQAKKNWQKVVRVEKLMGI